MSFGAFLGDWSRYIPAETPRRKVIAAAFLAQAATIVPFVFGLATATVIARTAPAYLDAGAPNYVGGLLAISTGCYFAPLCLIALIGGMSAGTTALYGTGLDFSSVFTRFTRVRATVGLAFVNVPDQFVGPLGNLAGGMDISLPLSLARAAVSYLVLLRLFPESRAVFGPAGPRWVPAKDTEVAPVTEASPVA